MKTKFPTPYPDVNEILNLLLANSKQILGDQFIGMYLYGSLSSGDFNLKTSDIDFLVVTKDALPDNTISELESMHQRIWANGLKWASKLEGSYVPQTDIRRHDPNHAPSPAVNERKFSVEKRGSDWILQRHVIREWGVVLAGPDPKALIDPVSPDDIRRAALGILKEWWFPMLEDASWLKSHGREYHAFAILTMCRALHALKHGKIVSKPVAARWAQNELDSNWSQVIERSLAQNVSSEDQDLYHEALDFIRFTMNTVHKRENERT